MIYIGIRLDCTDQTTTYSDVSMGLRDGVFTWITGDPRINGDKTLVLHGSGDPLDDAYWHSGLLVIDSISPVQSQIKLSLGGGIAEPGSFSFKLAQGSGFERERRTMGLEIINRPVIVYLFDTSDGDSFTARPIFRGKVENHSHSADEISVSCVDTSMDQLSAQAFPPTKINIESAAERALGKATSKPSIGGCIPIALGTINEAKFIKLREISSAIPVSTTTDSEDSFIAPVVAYSSTTSANKLVVYVEIYNGTLQFSENDLQGLSLVGAVGPNTGTYLIKSNDDSVVYSGPNYKTRIYLHESLDTSLSGSNLWDSGDTSLTIQYVKIQEKTETYVGSESEIDSFKDSDGVDGFNCSTWEEDNEDVKTRATVASSVADVNTSTSARAPKGEFIDISGLPSIASEVFIDDIAHDRFKQATMPATVRDNIDLYHPTIAVRSSDATDNDDKFRINAYIEPVSVKLVSIDDSIGDLVSNADSLPSPGGECPRLNDGDLSTYYDVEIDLGGSEVTVPVVVVFDIDIPQDSVIRSTDMVSVMLDSSFIADTPDGGGSNTLTLNMFVQGVDEWGRVTRALPSSLSTDINNANRRVWAQDDFGADVEQFMYLIPAEYYGLPFDDDRDAVYNNRKNITNFSEAVSKDSDLQIYKKIRVTIQIFPFFNDDEAHFHWYLRQLAIVCQQRVDINPSALFASIKGEKSFQTHHYYQPGDRDHAAEDPSLNADDLFYRRPRGAVSTGIEAVEYLMRRYQSIYNIDCASFDEVLGYERSVRIRAFSNVASLNGEQTIEGIDLVDGDLILLTEQTDPTENGIWIVRDGLDWERSPGFDADHIFEGIRINIEEGIEGDGASNFTYELVTAGPYVMGTTELEFDTYSEQPSGKHRDLRIGCQIQEISKDGIRGCIDDILRLSLCGMALDDDGNWYVNYLMPFSSESGPPTIDGDVIDRATISDVSWTDPSEVYNQLQVGYDINHETGDPRASVSVLRVAEDAFPSSVATDPETGELLWRSFVTGIVDYNTAKDLWDDCHASYTRIGTVNTLSLDAYWFSSSRRYIDDDSWDDSIIEALGRVISWVKRPKAVVRCKIPLTIDNLDHKLLDVVRFEDPLVWPDIEEIFSEFWEGRGYVSRRVIDIENSTIELEIMMRPASSGIEIPEELDEGAEGDVIDENRAPDDDTYTESGSDTIDENF